MADVWKPRRNKIKKYKFSFNDDVIIINKRDIRTIIMSLIFYQTSNKNEILCQLD